MAGKHRLELSQKKGSLLESDQNCVSSDPFSQFFSKCAEPMYKKWSLALRIFELMGVPALSGKNQDKVHSLAEAFRTLPKTIEGARSHWLFPQKKFCDRLSLLIEFH